VLGEYHRQVLLSGPSIRQDSNVIMDLQVSSMDMNRIELAGSHDLGPSDSITGVNILMR
jgi:hypothetical protein